MRKPTGTATSDWPPPRDELSVQIFTFPNFPSILHFTVDPPRFLFANTQMDSSPAAASAAASAFTLRHSSSPSHHYLDLFSSPPPLSPSAVASSDEFNESEVFWTSDFAQSNNRPFRTRKISTEDRTSSFDLPNSGILAALSDDADFNSKQRIGTIVTRETSMAMAISSSSSRSIPKPIQSSREYSQSMPSRKFQQSAPINVPKAMRKQRINDEICAAAEEEEDEEMLPPHEIVARGVGVMPNTTFSMLEGVGRTLKGRDLRQVRNAVWHRTGFVD
ncbi:hypothetical protein SDJN02_09302, partial [Cucurbita argyrosperma subsp. argyrosperma]|uniref:Uncharacterized protein LOC111448027 n=2 Tax=Cucurbita TaxID=3660 RepID=A0A6J1FXK6_CUCMO